MTNRFHTVPWLVMSLCCWLSVPVYAQRDLISGLAEAIDSDKDGKLSAEELERMRDRRRQVPILPGGKHVKIDPATSTLYKLAKGPLPVQRLETVSLERAGRGGPLLLRITWPEHEAAFPLIVFSHGMLGSKDAYQPLIEHWVSHGYVCIQPTHGDSLDALKPGDSLNLMTLMSHWAKRPEEVRLILDSLDKIEQAEPKLKGRIDHQVIGVGGHSFGAHTSELVAGVTARTLRRTMASHADERPLAFVWISPTGVGGQFTRDSFKEVKRPVLAITGSKDDSPINQVKAASRREAYDLLPTGDKYFLYIDGAYHGFGGIAGDMAYRGSGPRWPDHVSYVQSTTLAFWDAYLKKESPAKESLKSGKIEDLTDGDAKLESK